MVLEAYLQNQKSVMYEKPSTNTKRWSSTAEGPAVGVIVFEPKLRGWLEPEGPRRSRGSMKMSMSLKVIELPDCWVLKVMRDWIGAPEDRRGIWTACPFCAVQDCAWKIMSVAAWVGVETTTSMSRLDPCNAVLKSVELAGP